jgi:hypothetical protein
MHTRADERRPSTSLRALLLTLVCVVAFGPGGAWARGDKHLASLAGDDVGSYDPERGSTTPEGSDQPRDGGGSSGSRWVIPAILVGVAALAALNSMNSKAAEEPAGDERLNADERRVLDDMLSRGPLFPPQYNTSAFAVIGAARANWPLVVDFERTRPGYVWLRVRGRGTDVYTFALHPLGTGRKVVQMKLPPELGDTLRPVVVSVIATEDAGGKVPLPDFRFYGLGCGPRSVGSVAINQLQFGPPDVDVNREEQALYRFRTSSSFQRVAVEFVRVPEDRDGVRQLLVQSQLLAGGTQPGQVIGIEPPGTWDGRDPQRQVSSGDHRLRVRGWHGEGDWVSAFSDNTVRVLN